MGLLDSHETEGYASPCSTFSLRKRPHKYSCHATTMSHIIHFEPSYYEDETIHPVWRDVMMEEYQSILKSDVWDIVLRPEGKFVVTSKWIYNIKHTIDWSIDRNKIKFVSRAFS
jgi:hypothetical protein